MINNLDSILEVAREREEYQADVMIGDNLCEIIFLMEGEYDSVRRMDTYNIIKFNIRNSTPLIHFMVGYKEEDFGFVMETDNILVLDGQKYITQNKDSKNRYLQLDITVDDMIKFFKVADLKEYFRQFKRAYSKISIKEREIKDEYLNIQRVIS